MTLTNDLGRLYQAALATNGFASMPVAAIAFLWETDDERESATLEARIYRRIDDLMRTARSKNWETDTDPYADGQDHIDGLCDDPFRLRVSLWDLARWARDQKHFPEFLRQQIAALVIGEALNCNPTTIGAELGLTGDDIQIWPLVEAYEATLGKVQIPISVAALCWMAEFPNLRGKSWVGKFRQIQQLILNAARSGDLDYATPQYLPCHANDWDSWAGLGYKVSESGEIGAYDLTVIPARVVVARRDLAKWAIQQGKTPRFLAVDIDRLEQQEAELLKHLEHLEPALGENLDKRFEEVLDNLDLLDDTGGIPLAVATKAWALATTPEADLRKPVKLSKDVAAGFALARSLMEEMRAGKILYSIEPWEWEMAKARGEEAGTLLSADFSEPISRPAAFIQDPWILRVRIMDLALFEAQHEGAPDSFRSLLRHQIDRRLPRTFDSRKNKDSSSVAPCSGHPKHIDPWIRFILNAYEEKWASHDPKDKRRKRPSDEEMIRHLSGTKVGNQKVAPYVAKAIAMIIKPVRALGARPKTAGEKALAGSE